MRFLLLLIGWCLLLVLCWPLALLVIVLAPILWLVSIPLRLFVWVVGATLALIRSILYLPARLLGHRPT